MVGALSEGTGCDVGAREGGGRRRELGVLRALSVVPGVAEAL
jgi:hypothetical protein